jgi:dTDP-4-dehydrorhamnose 3,5-epimerase
MKFSETPVDGAYVVEVEPLADERGFFARTWCQHEFLEHGLDPSLAQCSISFNRRRGTIRGMHLQLPSHAEAKLVRCTRGTIYDVALDLRPLSPSYMQWYAVELSAENRKALYVPKGCAHGFQTLTDETEILYLISEFYAPEAARGVRWNDPQFQIRWPEPVSVISEKDNNYQDYDPARFGALGQQAAHE